MDTFELNKYAGAFLGALLAIYVINEIGNILVHPSAPEETAIAVAVPESTEPATTATASAEPQKPLAVLLVEADAAAGEKQAKKCASCHTFDKGGANRIGPNLYGVVGRAKAAAEGFGYSDAMREKGGDWSYAALDEFLEKPKDYMPGTKMAFPGIRKAEDRADVILYLRQQSDSPPPLPEP